MAEPRQPRSLPKPDAETFVPAVSERIALYPQGLNEFELEEAAVPFTHYLWLLKHHRWKILVFVGASLVATAAVSSRLTPIYESTATLDIDREMPSGVIGEAANRSVLNDSDQFLATQIKLIQSDSVLRPVAQRYKIPPSDTTNRDSELPTARAEDAPVVLKRLRVTRPTNTYLLLIHYRSPDPQYAADVANGIAQSYIEHTYNIRFRATAGLSAFMEKQLEELKAKMERSSGALAQFEKELNVINPEEKTNILSARLLQLNTEFTNAQADRVRREAAYNSVQSGSLDATQASTQGEQLRRLSDRIDEARERFATVKIQYGANHPEYKKAFSQLSELERQLGELSSSIARRVGLEYQEAANRERMLQDAVAETKAEYDRLNARSFEYRAHKEEADADRLLYQELERKIKEAGINSSFQNSAIRLADPARAPLLPVFPNIRLNLLLAALFSTLVAIAASVISDALDNTVRDPEQLQRGLKTEVIGSLPVVKAWRGRFLPVSNNGAAVQLLPAGKTNQVEAFEEAVRTLRDSILLSDLGRRPRSLLITSATPREGKTTTAMYLAVAHSLQKRKTLLIDADLRRPSLHTRFDLPAPGGGLAAVIEGQTTWRDATQTPDAYPDLDILPAGPASRRVADRLGGTLGDILLEAEADYDLVVVDSPPLLKFAEPLQIAALVDGVVVIAVAGQTNRNAVASVINSLKRLKANIIGVALNEVREDMSDRYYYYGYYGEQYSKHYKPGPH